MTAKVIKFPSLVAGLTLSCKVRNISTLAVLETVALTPGSGDNVSLYDGTITGAHAGQLLFELLVSGVVIEKRVRTIQDSAGPWVILTELDQLASDGRGAHLVTITVNDGAAVLQNCLVRVTAGVLSEVRTTNVSGVGTFALDNATYTVTVTRAGYTSAVATLVVSGTTTATYSLTLVAVTMPDSPLVATGSLLVLDENNNPEVAVPHSLQMTAGPGTSGYSLDTKIRTVNSNGSGIVSFTRLRRGATYSIWRGPANDSFSASAFVVQAASTRQSFVVPNADTFSIDEVLGLDAEA